jgi:hypothetical protein
VKTLALLDFSKGYDTDTDHARMDNRSMVRAENCIWREGLDQRTGHRPYGTSTYASGDVIRGVSERVYLNAAWVSIEAVDVAISAQVRFFVRATTAITQLSAVVVFTTGIPVCFAVLNGKIVATNGTDKPVVIYYSGGWQITTLEAYDARTWEITAWNAGQYDASEDPAGVFYVDDTVDAQDADADDFQLGNATVNDGFIIACASPFNKVVFTSAQQAGGAPVAEYKYWKNDNTWATLTLTTTPVWTAAAGDRTMEWDYLSTMGRYNGTTSGLANYFLIRVRFTTAAAGAFSCDTISVKHTQYLSEILAGEKPKYCVAHGSRMWMSTGYIVIFSPPNDVIGWRGLSESEYFLEGGPEVRGMLSHKGYLIIFKDNAVYHFYGSGIDTFQRQKITDHGIAQPYAFTRGGDEVYFLSADGIRVLQGVNCYRVSKHIKTDIDAFTKTGATATEFNGEVYFSFPSDSYVLWFDPDTLTIDDETGEGRVSFYKFTAFQAHFFIKCDGNSDTGYFLAGVNTTQPYIARLMNGETDQNRAGTAAAIDFRFQSAYLLFGRLLAKKAYGLLKTWVKQDAYDAMIYTLVVYADDGARSKSATFTAKAGSRYHAQQSRIPYQLDGYNLSIEVRNNEQRDAGLRGFEIEYAQKEF